VERSEVGIRTLELSFADPGITRVHRVGLFGLWASLRALEENGASHSMKNVHWQLHSNGLHLTFSPGWRDGIDELVRHAFGVTSEGFVRIAAIGDPRGDPAGTRGQASGEGVERSTGVIRKVPPAMSRASWYLVGYDVRDPERLRRVSTLLNGYGERVQYSVFRCRLSDVQKERMLWELARLMWPEDSLVVVPLCRGCYGRIEIKGCAEWADDPNIVVL